MFANIHLLCRKQRTDMFGHFSSKVTVFAHTREQTCLATSHYRSRCSAYNREQTCLVTSHQRSRCSAYNREQTCLATSHQRSQCSAHNREQTYLVTSHQGHSVLHTTENRHVWPLLIEGLSVLPKTEKRKRKQKKEKTLLK